MQLTHLPGACTVAPVMHNPASMQAKTIAKWFIDRANSEFVDDNGVAEGITNLKLQKLLYFAQAASLSIRGETLFDDAIEAWKFGPVVPSVYHALKERGNSVIPNGAVNDDTIIPSEIAVLLEDVWNIYGKFSAFELVNMSHAHKPWKDVFMKRGDGVISIESMRTYYESFFTAA